MANFVQASASDLSHFATTANYVWRLKWMLFVAVLGWVFWEVTARWLNFASPLQDGFVNRHFYALPMLSLTMLHLFSSPRNGELYLTALAAAGLTAGLWIWAKAMDVQPPPTMDVQMPYVVFACIGCGAASFLVMLGRMLISAGAERYNTKVYLLAGMLSIGFSLYGPFVMRLSTHIHPTTLDPLMFEIDGTLGCQPSFLMGQWFAAFKPFGLLSTAVYATLSFAVLFVFLMQLRTRPLPPMDILTATAVAAFFAPPLYYSFPVCGPDAVFRQDFPQHPCTPSELWSHTPGTYQEPPGTPPHSYGGKASTCVPSLHTTMALLIWWHARPLARWARGIAGIYLVFTLCATIGLGMHYFFDLVVSFPYALAIQAICTPHRPETHKPRLVCFILGASLYAAGLIGLHYGLPVLRWSPWIGWGVTVVTVVFCWRVESWLYRRGIQAASRWECKQ